jgi:hypothetical protein
VKKFLFGLAVVGLVAFVGCNTSPTGGGNPTSTTTHGKLSGKPDTFTLTGPSKVMAKEIKHNASETFDVTINRGKEFKEDLTFSAAAEPMNKGVTAEVEPKTVKASDPNKVNVKVQVKETAAPGPYKVIVNAKPPVGEPTGVEFDVKVPEKK